jgi:hypothetical protein
VNEGGRQQRWTRSEINQMAFAAQEGEASKDDARTLLALFCECVEHGLISARNPVADRLLEHVREAFRAYLNGERVGKRDGKRKRDGKPGIVEIDISSIESALGLVRKRGRPKADEQMRMQMAAEVLRYRLDGEMPHQEALAAVERKFGWGQTIIGEAWRDYKQSALLLVRLDRDPDGFTMQEKEKVCKIFEDEEWLITPGKSKVFPK